MPKRVGQPHNGPLCRLGRHPWPESRVIIGVAIRRSACGPCITQYEKARKQPSKKIRPTVWNKATGRAHNKRATLIEEYDFMISCGMSFHHVANTFGILPGSLEKALSRAGRFKSNNWKA